MWMRTARVASIAPVAIAPSAAVLPAISSGRSACTSSPAPFCGTQQLQHPRQLQALPGRMQHSVSRAMSTSAAVGSAASTAATKRVLLPVANGTEEMEAVIVIDVLRRAGAEVLVASVEDTLQVTCSRGVKLVADVLIGDAASQSFDLIALPGGMPGAERLRDSAPLEALLREQRSAGKRYAAICATPAVFFEAKGLIGPGQKATAHPAFSGNLKEQSAVEQRVVVDGLLTTSRGPGTAFEFALSLVRQLCGKDKADAIASAMVMYT